MSDEEPKGNVISLQFGKKKQTAQRPAEVDTPTNQYSKFVCFQKLLEFGEVSIGINTSVSGVDLPSKLMESPVVILKYSYKYKISDFNFMNGEIVASLKFGTQDIKCVVPWRAVFTMASQQARESIAWPINAPVPSNIGA